MKTLQQSKAPDAASLAIVAAIAGFGSRLREG